ncbi:hypothetical protein OUZ56_001394 [Daphnia magna]|uniref:Uncharacterized protein n=1 Tax=Daphnia magna TaxID=35525 RepID=A0ABR0A2I0_9CRUS|nr:hypothetical protein OUZ56_001394 [Daphnia magna]
MDFAELNLDETQFISNSPEIYLFISSAFCTTLQQMKEEEPKPRRVYSAGPVIEPACARFYEWFYSQALNLSATYRRFFHPSNFGVLRMQNPLIPSMEK